MHLKAVLQTLDVEHKAGGFGLSVQHQQCSEESRTAVAQLASELVIQLCADDVTVLDMPNGSEPFEAIMVLCRAKNAVNQSL